MNYCKENTPLNLPWYFLALPVGMFIVSIVSGFFCFWCFEKACYWWEYGTEREWLNAPYFTILTIITLGVTICIILGAVYCCVTYIFGKDPIVKIDLKAKEEGGSFEDHLKKLEADYPGSPLGFKIKCALFFILDPVIFLALLLFFWWFLIPLSMTIRHKWIRNEIREEYRKQGNPELNDGLDLDLFADYGFLLIAVFFVFALILYPIMHF